MTSFTHWDKEVILCINHQINNPRQQYILSYTVNTLKCINFEE